MHYGLDAALTYNAWADALPATVEVVAVQTPSALSLTQDAPTSMANYVDELIELMDPLLDRPYAFFGHSFGAHAAYVTAARLQVKNPSMAPPLRVFASGALAPGADGDAPLADGWDTKGPEGDAVLREALLSWGGVSSDILDDAESVATLTDMLRTDLLVMSTTLNALLVSSTSEGDTAGAGATDGSTRSAPLRCPLTAVGGDADAVTNAGEGLASWAPTTSSDFQTISLSGDHFYLGTEQPSFGALMDLLADQLSKDTEAQIDSALMQMHRWNSERMPYPHDRCLHEVFEEQARRTPDKVAIVDPAAGISLTFREVDQLTTELATMLHHRGVGPDQPVGIFFERSAEYLLAYIAAHKAGGAYMPIETVYPPDLLARVCSSVTPKVVFTKQHLVDRLPAEQGTFVFDEDWKERLAAMSLPRMPEDRPKPTPDSLAYVVMSSGTTGVPKGIMCPHRGAVFSYNWRHEMVPYDDDGEDREACNVFFVWECLRALLRGRPTYVIPDDVIYDPVELVRYLSEHKITRVLFTPSLAQLTMDSFPADHLKEALKTMRVVWLCGEVVSVDLARKLFAALPQSCKILNLYSISECHDVSVADVRRMDSELSMQFAPCGRVLPNVRAYVVDEALRPVPIGLPGEVVVAGPTLAIGYLQMPEATHRRFPRNPFVDSEPVNASAPAGSENSTRLYRTGDRGRYLPDGSLEIVGRMDFMVKIRGYSVVLGAVEAALTSHPAVKTVAVVVEGKETEDKRLIAYVVPESWDGPRMSTNELRKFAQTKLPHYAIPSMMFVLQSLPLNAASGKLDLKKLPKSESADGSKSDSSTDLAMRTSMRTGGALSRTETELRGVWASLLGSSPDAINVHSSFFESGGHSLLAARLSQVVRDTFDVAFPVSAIIEFQSLRHMARALDSHRTKLTDTELKLREVWGELLRKPAEDVAPGISFIEAGGHSLSAAKLSAEINKRFGVRLPVSAVLELTSLRDMAATIEKLSPEATSGSSVKAETPPPPPPAAGGAGRERSLSALSTAEATVTPEDDLSLLSSDSFHVPATRHRVAEVRLPPARVFVTGSTGYLGAFIVAEALKRTHATLYCLIRATSPEHAIRRLGETLAKYGLWDDVKALTPGRVVPVLGDLAKPGLGMATEAIRALEGEVDAIIHCGAHVNLVAPYHALRRPNVLGTQGVLLMAVKSGFFNTFSGHRLKTVHYISSNGIVPQARTSFDESDAPADWRELEDGYARTKFVGEHMIRSAMSEGLPASILRPGNMGPTASGVWNQSDFVYLLINGCIELGMIPTDAGWSFDVTPVDFAAAALVELAINGPANVVGQTMHLQTRSKPLAASDVFSWVVEAAEAQGKTIRRVSLAEFRAGLASAADYSSPAGSSDAVTQLAAGLASFEPYLSAPPSFGSERLHAALDAHVTRTGCAELPPSTVSASAVKAAVNRMFSNRDTPTKDFSSERFEDIIAGLVDVAPSEE